MGYVKLTESCVDSADGANLDCKGVHGSDRGKHPSLKLL